MTRRAGAIGCIAAALALGAVSAASAAEPILPLDQVRPGMVGEARTVVQGTQITGFPVRVVDVQADPGVPGGSLILIRAEGPLMEQTGGIAQGMSGSPVYVTGDDGVARVMGAVAYGTGDEGNVLGGVTPIEQMIRPTEGRLDNARPRAAGPARPLVHVATRAQARAREHRRPAERALYPLVRWTASGLRPRVTAGLRRELAPQGVQLDATAGRGRRPRVPLVPGASLSVLLVAGDATVGAVGTVTWVDGRRLLGFGHPFLGLGATRLLLGDAYVFETVPARQDASSYKLAEAGGVQGVITADRADGVSGLTGPADAVRLVAAATDRGRGTRSVVRTWLTPDPRVAPQVADALQAEPLARAVDGLPAGTLTLRVRVTGDGLPRPVTYRNRYAASADLAPVTEGALRRILNVLMANGLRPVTPRTVVVQQVLDRRVRAARILSARVVPARVRAGARARLEVTLQPWRAAPRRVRLPIRIPAGLEPGAHALRVVPNALGGFATAPPDVNEQLGQAVTLGDARSRRLLGRVEGLATRAGGTRMQRLLTGLARATRDRHDALRVLPPDADEADPEAGRTLPVPWVVYGGRAVARVRVR